jgi:phosphate-selective porin OprO/OprP
VTWLVEAGLAVEDRSRDDDGNVATPRVPVAGHRSYGISGDIIYSFCQRHAPGRVADPGALEVGLRVDRLWLGHGADDLTPSGALSGALATKWWPNTITAVSLVATIIDYDEAAIEDPERTTSWGIIARLSLWTPRR